MHAGHHVFGHIPHIHFFKLPEEVEHFYLLAFVRFVLTVTGGLFFPIFIYAETQSLTLVFLYMLLAQGLAKLPIRPFNLWVLRNHGVEWAMFLSIVFAGLEYTLAYFFGMTVLAVFFYGFLEGISGAIYWDAYHTSFGLFGREKDSAEEVAGLQVVQNLTGIFLPLISAVFIKMLGFHTFYAFVFIGTILASLYLLSRFGETHKVNFTMRDVIYVPYRALHLSDGIQWGFAWIMPIFTYLVFSGKVVLFGALKTAIAAAMAVFSFLVARYFDRKNAFGLGRVPYIGNAIFIPLQAMFPTPIVVTLGELGRSFTNTFAVAISATMYRIVKHRSPALSVGRSFFVSAGKSISFAFILILAYLAENGALALAQVDVCRTGLFLVIPFAISSCLLYGKMEREAESYA
ncbi:MAG: hypothetical protein PWP76_573 [Candidatus Diapherotrites archaeon]|nr:hypothetical protein [Candidatus Diapherotrites archaeon]MDN5367151.1 hypothetical protein [Candidatus Diapherotrites archaeon]